MSGTEAAGRVARWVTQSAYEDIPRRVSDEAKNQLLSTLAAVHAGYFAEVGRAIRRAAKELAPGREATLIPQGERVSVQDALFMNCALAHSLDYDDYLVGTSVGASAALVPLMLAETNGLTGKDLLSAQVAANEIAGRVALAVSSPHLQPWMHGGPHAAASAVASARAFGFDAEKAAAAIGLALSFPPSVVPTAYLASDARAFSAAFAVGAGVRAAQLVAQGVGAWPDGWCGDGVLACAGQPPISNLFDQLGSVWVLDTICYKPYPGCVSIDAAVDAALELLRMHSLDARKIRSVAVAAASPVVAADERVRPFVSGAATPPSVLTSWLRYSVAAALTDKELTARQFTKEKSEDSAIWELAERISLTEDEALTRRAEAVSIVRTVETASGPRRMLENDPIRLNQFRPPFGARVRIELADGRSFEAERDIPSGAPGRMFDDRRKLVQDKFRRETRYTLRKEKMEKAIDIVLHLEQANAATVRELVRLCCSDRD